MIRAMVTKKAGRYKAINISGHSGYKDNGSDIVCAAVSALVINFVNSVESLTDEPHTVSQDTDAGVIDFRFTGDTGRDATLLADSLVTGLKSVADDYYRYIKLEIKEV